ncbi:LCP family protein [Streptomyces gibsoniae]|uniref:LCP family protein n=1 Tax=Streptomyces gibsoniae TaxID=3075529 RepID=A0ABU2U5U0_9ACTN|nr:LCP family protein [Streptomyces sp. DSM 41699]MDT0468510.1 LCP family protein [Streptomyces sp. DSM 41699]
MTGLSLLILTTAGLGWIYLTLTRNIDTFNEAGLSDKRPGATGGGENVLVIGSDGRVNGNDALGGGSKDDIGRSDTAFLLHVYADRRHALAVSIPRDALVTIPPCRLPDGSWTQARINTMFNAAYSVGQTARGNPACTQNTVEQLTGLRVDHTVVVDFKGFAQMTEAVGGVPVCVPQDVYQKDLSPGRATRGRLLLRKGEQTLSGKRALDYVRIRHGIGDGSDIGRIKRQQAFVAGLIKKVKSVGLTPANLLPLAEAAIKSLTVDSGLGTADKLISFAMSLKNIDLHNTKFVTVPWRYHRDRVALVHPDADELWAALKADRPIDAEKTGGAGPERRAPTGPPSTEPTVSGHRIAVAVYNATTASGLASTAARSLTLYGFAVAGTGSVARRDQTTTVIQYASALRLEAEQVARLFPGAQLQPVNGRGITVVLGQSYAASALPAVLPHTPVTSNTRSADDAPCSELSYG